MKKNMEELLEMKPLLPGTLEKHYNVCGKSGCRCKDKNNPQKHGPYYRLSYSMKGKNSSVFVRAEDADTIKQMTDNYRTARGNTQDLALEMVEKFRKKGLQGMLAEYNKLSDRHVSKLTDRKPQSQHLRDARISRDKWKKKALQRQSDLADKAVRIRDLETSRENWKKKALDAQNKLKDLHKELDSTNRKLDKIEKNRDNKKNSSEAN